VHGHGDHGGVPVVEIPRGEGDIRRDLADGWDTVTADTRTPGKAHGLVRISDGCGRYAMLAIDQRPPLFELVARALGRPEDSVAGDVGVLKGMLAETLAAETTGLLVDPLYGYPNVLPVLPRTTGLLLTLEDHRFETTADGYRRSRMIRDWSVARAVRAGADALKLLVWYRSDAPADVRAHQEHLVQQVGEACAAVDRPFVLELLPYPLPGETEGAYARKLPELSLRLVDAFAAPAFRVDLYKIALPGAPDAVTDWGGALYGLQEMRDLMTRTTELLPTPWVLLSGGMASDRFITSMALAADAGARGYLAGRAVWGPAVRAYPDAETVRRRLTSDAVSVLQSLNRVVETLTPARPEAQWQDAVRGIG
jgi:tagatose 1,6-diphosphate aldolase